MRSSKKIPLGLPLTVLCLLAMLFTACGGSSATGTTAEAPTSQQTLRLSIHNPDFPTLDPGQETDAVSAEGIYLLFTGLVKLDDNLKIQPQLAQSYDVSSDRLTYTFHLRPNLKFSDGTPLTSQDVVYSIDRALSPQISSLNGVSLTYLGLIKDAEGRTKGTVKSLINDSLLAPDPNTVIIKLNQATGYFLETLAYPTSYVVEKSVIDKWGLKWTDHLSDNGGQGGDGPFKVQNYNHTTAITLVPNANYEQKKPQLQKLIISFFKTTEAQYQAYQANQVDSTSVPTEEFQQAKTRTSEFRTFPSLGTYSLEMNYLAKPFDNINIRQAFELALNKDVIAQDVFKGADTPTCHIVPAGMPGYNPHLTCPFGAPTSGDPAKAKQLFAEGLQEEGFTLATFPSITITSYANSSTYDNAITTAEQMWKNVLGVTNIHETTLQFGQLVQAESNTVGKTPAQGGLQMWFGGWLADYPDPQDWLTLQFGLGSPNNQVNYGQNNSTDAAIQQQAQQQMAAADVMPNGAARYQAYYVPEQQAVNDVAWLPLIQSPSTNTGPGAALRKPYVYGIVDNGVGEFCDPNDWANIYITVH
ncbi:MAG: peptide ABC transporter substrate-binding protein [Chloroflexi bacterium]|nr:peptide ABC transporter substrate-binding protein [Chloroflexota bacterium]